MKTRNGNENEATKTGSKNSIPLESEKKKRNKNTQTKEEKNKIMDGQRGQEMRNNTTDLKYIEKSVKPKNKINIYKKKGSTRGREMFMGKGGMRNRRGEAKRRLRIQMERRRKEDDGEKQRKDLREAEEGMKRAGTSNQGIKNYLHYVRLPPQSNFSQASIEAFWRARRIGEARRGRRISELPVFERKRDESITENGEKGKILTA